MKETTKFLTRTALFAAVIAILSPFTIPVGPVPVTLSLLAVLLCAVTLDVRMSLAAVGAYILLGAIGLPVFSSAKGGFGVLLGATGGYIWSYLLAAAAASVIAGNARARGRAQYIRAFAGCIVGTLICYLCGTPQFALVTGNALAQSVAVCVLPFIVPDIAKCLIAALLGTIIRSRI